MPSKNSENRNRPPEIVEKTEIKEKTEKADLKLKIDDLTTAEEYLAWKKMVPNNLRSIIEGVMLGLPEKPDKDSLPLVGQYISEFRKAMLSGDLSQDSEIDNRVLNMLKPLENVKTVTGGVVNVFRVMADKDTSWSLRQKLYDLQIKPALEWLAKKDLEKAIKDAKLPATDESKDDGEENQGEKSPDTSDLPDQSDEAVSSMESGAEKGEGEPIAKFTVAPFFGGYYRQKILDKFNSSGRWVVKKDKKLEKVALVSLDNLRTRVIFGKVRGGGKPLALPLPYNWGVEIDSLNCSAESAKILRDENGLWYLQIDESGVFDYDLKIAPQQMLEEENESDEMDITGNIPLEASEMLQKIQLENPAKMKQAKAIVKAVRARLEYSNNPEAWKKYTSNINKFFENVWQNKEADCFTANTVAIRLLKEAGILCRFVAGHYIKGKNDKNQAVLHSGSGHAWLEVWDEIGHHWVRLDATPKGDPNVDEEEQEKDLNGDSGEGDFGEDDEIMSEKKVEEKIEELKKEGGSGGGKKKRKNKEVGEENKRASDFSEKAGCTPEQAGEFLRALDRVRMIKNEQGVAISDLLKDEWKKIVIARKIENMDYRGPVRMDEGDILEDPVSAKIDIMSKEFNPTGFEKLKKKEKIKMDFGGINIYFSFDLSGSMAWNDGSTGRKKSDVQRDVALLFIDSLMQCSYISRQSGDPSELLPIKIMATLASTNGQPVLHLTDRWEPAEQWKVYSSLIKLASGGTPTHETLDLIEKDMVKEQEQLKKDQISADKLPIHYVVEISDGTPDDFDETEARHESLKEKGAVIRSYCIGGESKSADAAPPLSSFSQLPNILAQDVTEEFKKLNPRRIKT